MTARTHFTDRAGMNRAYLAREIFKPYYRLLNELQAGEVTCIEDTPVVEWKDQIEPDFAILHGFVGVWGRVQAKRPCGLDLAPLTNLANKLESGVPLFAADLAAARECIAQCKRQAARLTVAQAVDLVRMVQIGIEMGRHNAPELKGAGR